MRKNSDKPSLTLVSLEATAIPPPRKLGKFGLSLWNRVQSEYRVDDIGGVEILMQICAAGDRLEALGEEIRRDGTVIRTRSGPRAHPLLKEELGLRAFIVRGLQRLGLNVETMKPLGRPSGANAGWVPNAEQ
jgi:hypothetical protein